MYLGGGTGVGVEMQELSRGHSKQRKANKQKAQRTGWGPVSRPEVQEHWCKPRPGTFTVDKAGRLDQDSARRIQIPNQPSCPAEKN